MSVNRQEYLDIISIVSHLARSDGDIADSEKKVLMTLFKAIGVTKEEQAAMKAKTSIGSLLEEIQSCLLYTSPSPRDGLLSRMPSSA